MDSAIFKIETLREDDFDEWVEHCGSIFPVGPAYFRRHFENDPHRDINSIFIVKDAGRIISTVRIFRREIYLFGGIYTMGGIGEVSTNKEYRRRGLSYALLEHAGEYMRNNGFHISLLSAGYFLHIMKNMAI